MKPEISIGVGLATATVVFAIFSNATPTIADIRQAPPGNADIASSEKAATWTSAAVVGGISLIAKDPTVFVIGGFMIIAMSWWTKHANSVHPETGKVTGAAAVAAQPAQTQMQDSSQYGYDGAMVMV